MTSRSDGGDGTLPGTPPGTLPGARDGPRLVALEVHDGSGHLLEHQLLLVLAEALRPDAVDMGRPLPAFLARQVAGTGGEPERVEGRVAHQFPVEAQHHGVQQALDGLRLPTLARCDCLRAGRPAATHACSVSNSASCSRSSPSTRTRPSSSTSLRSVVGRSGPACSCSSITARGWAGVPRRASGLGRSGGKPYDYSPDGAVKVTPRETGVPKFGVPSAFQVNFCALVDRFMSQPPEAELLAW